VVNPGSAELDGMRKRELRAAALAAGVERDAMDEAEDDFESFSEYKPAWIELILATQMTIDTLHIGQTIIHPFGSDQYDIDDRESQSHQQTRLTLFYRSNNDTGWQDTRKIFTISQLLGKGRIPGIPGNFNGNIVELTRVE
jgi:hypothetical protein